MLTLLLLLLSTLNFSITTPVAILSSENNHVSSGTGLPTSTDSRSTQDIVWSCLATIFACTWVAVHPNIPGPWDSEWTMLKRRVTIMIYAMLAPEFMTMWAMLQWMAARRIASEFNIQNHEQLSVDSESNEESIENCWTAIKNPVIEWFKGPYSNRRRDYRWTSTHGFFIQMGGFVLSTDDQLERVLTFNDLQELIKKGEVQIPRITESEINSRSRCDFLTKALAVLQTSWFVLQCVARWASGVPVTELEVVTLAFATLNVFTYGLWWQKPQNVQLGVSIPWNTMDDKWHRAHRTHGDGRGADRTEESLRERIRIADEWKRDMVGENIRDKDMDKLDVREKEMELQREVLRETMRQRDRARVTKIRQEAEESLRERERVKAQINAWNQMVRENITSGRAAGSEWQWAQEMVEKGQVREIEMRMRRAGEETRGTSTDTHKSWARRRLAEAIGLGLCGWFKVPWILLLAFLRPLSKMSGFTNNVLGSRSLRIPMFWKEQTDSRVDFPVLTIGVLFGSLHLIPWWSGSFLSTTELWLWRSSALTITVEPMMVFALRLADSLRRHRDGWLSRTLFVTLRIPAIMGIPLYILARLVLLTLAFMTLRGLPPAAFVDINWTTFLPHV